MPQALRTFQTLSHKSNEHKQANPAAHEDENLIDTRDALASVQHASGEAMHQSVLQLQRTIGNKAVSEMVSQRNTQPSVQREIEMESSGLPKMDKLFDSAAFVITRLVNVDTYKRFRDALSPTHPVKTKTFQEAWAIKTMRPTILKFAEAEYSPENVKFLLAVEAYKEAPTADKAIEIYNEYISAGSPSQVNISGETRLEYAAAHTSLTAAPATRARS